MIDEDSSRGDPPGDDLMRELLSILRPAGSRRVLRAVLASPLCLATLLSLSSTIALGQNVRRPVDERAAIVLAVTGEWFIYGRTPGRAGRGRALASGDTIRVGRNPLPSHGVTLLLADGTRVRRQCTVDQGCGDPVVIPRSDPSSAPVRWLNAVLSRISRDPPFFQVPATRGGTLDDGELRDGVAPLRDGRIDLRQIFMARDGARPVTRFLLRRVTHASPAGAPDQARLADTMALTWTQADSTRGVAASVGPGLYEIEFANDPSQSAWVLVASGPATGEVVTDFASAQATARKWGNATAASERRLFLRATLDYLADRYASAASEPR